MLEPLKVVVRYRPLNALELKISTRTCLEQISETQISIFNNNQQKIFSFDKIFNDVSQQIEIYNQSAKLIIENVNKGYNGTIFAYGQTGSGKTHTMMGNQDGIIPSSFQQIMQYVQSNLEYEFLIHCQYVEIYNENVFDLLEKNKTKYDIKESPEKGFYIKNLKNSIVKNFKDLNELIIKGNKNRQTAQTFMNYSSSRSHSLFILNLEIIKNNQVVKASKLNLVDLAGSEKICKSQVEDQNLKEAQKINQSLSALGNVIFALSDQKTHIPFRDSKLTKLLNNSLGGNSKTLMIACVSPSVYNYEETLSTLRYAGRASKIINKPMINQDPKEALLKEYLQQISELKQQLQEKNQHNINIINNTQVNIQYSNVRFESIQQRIQYIKQRQSLLQQSQSSLLDKDDEKNETQQKLDKILQQIQDIKIKPLETTREHFKQIENKSNVIQSNTEIQQFQQQIIQLKQQIEALQKQNQIKKLIIQKYIPHQDYQQLKNKVSLKNNEIILPKLTYQTNKSLDVEKQIKKTRTVKSKTMLNHIKLKPLVNI